MRLRIRTAQVARDMVEAHSERTLALPINVADVRRVGSTPHGEQPLHSRLVTNATVSNVKGGPRGRGGAVTRSTSARNSPRA